ncbi:hypothetical protein GGR56DRAFT_560899 [Xylariaceae sp. FL0804]|nr:hypothetical protein GGR56DRAFT_560899 [Xylariaceae sp. FL0804]
MHLHVTQKQLLGGLLLTNSYKGSQDVIAKSNSSLQLIPVPGFVPPGASGVIDPDFPGLGFEESSFVRYALDNEGNPNAFSANLMEAIYSRTGGKPIIRLGGTSADYGKYLPGQEAPALPVAEQDNYQDVGNTTIGPSYWNLTHIFPSARYMVQVPMATTNISETIAWAQSAVDIIGLDLIHSIQPGNEADLYADDYTGEDSVPLQPPEYQGTLSNQTYVGNWTEYVSAIKEAVPEVPDGPFFTAFDTSTHFGDAVTAEKYIFDVPECFALGIDKGDVIKEVSHHYYQGHAGTAATLGTTLMPMNITHPHLDQYRYSIDFLNSREGGIPFILNEVGNSLDVTQDYAYQARLGSAVWQVDFYLYSMVVGVARINWQQIMHSGFDLWLPVYSSGYAPQVFANYYSQPFVADFIGASGAAQISKLEGRGLSNADNVAAYAAYEHGSLKRIALVNLNYWNQTSADAPRERATLDLALPDWARGARAYHLNSPLGAGADAASITYGGSQWTWESGGTEVKGVRNDTRDVPVRGGVARVSVEASEAVLLWLY